MQTVFPKTDSTPPPRSYCYQPSPRMMHPRCSESVCDVIYLVDDDPNIRDEISTTLGELHMKVVPFSSAGEYLSFTGIDTAACAILNLHLPDLCGLELQRRLVETSNPPIIFICSEFDVTATVQAMKAGAIDFLTKPLNLPALIAAVRTAFAKDRRSRHRKEELAKLQERRELLTPREREVLPLVVGGLLNKQSASLLGISEVTLQIHRSQVMRKMQANSLAELVRMAVKLRIPHWHESQSGSFRKAKRSSTGVSTLREVSTASIDM